MTIIRFHELREKPQMLVELLSELAVFLVAPARPKRLELGSQHGGLVGQDRVELLEPLGKRPQLLGIDDRLGHDFGGWGVLADGRSQGDGSQPNPMTP